MGRQVQEAMRRVSMNWPEFADRDVRAALQEACDDEDGAVDLLLGGFRAPYEAVGSVPAATGPSSPSADVVAIEEYPDLLSSAYPKTRSLALNVSNLSSWARA